MYKNGLVFCTIFYIRNTTFTLDIQTDRLGQTVQTQILTAPKGAVRSASTLQFHHSILDTSVGSQNAYLFHTGIELRYLNIQGKYSTQDMKTAKTETSLQVHSLGPVVQS